MPARTKKEGTSQKKRLLPYRIFFSYHLLLKSKRRKYSEYEEEFALSLFTPYSQRLSFVHSLEKKFRNYVLHEVGKKRLEKFTYGSEINQVVSPDERSSAYWHARITHTIIRNFVVVLEECFEVNVRPRFSGRFAKIPFISRLLEKIRGIDFQIDKRLPCANPVHKSERGPTD